MPFVISFRIQLQKISVFQFLFTNKTIIVWIKIKGLKEKKDLLLNASLSIDGIRLQISDNGPDFPYVAGTNMTACLQLDSAQEAKELYEKLTVDAKNIGLELQETPWSPAYANFTDKFGMNWQINADIPGFVSESVNF